MFEKGQLIVYGNIGVCEVKEITKQKFVGLGEKLYYSLSPLYQKGDIFSPVDATVFMRPIVTPAEVDALIDAIPDVTAEAYHERGTQKLAEHYREAFQAHNCADLIELIMSIYAKRQSMEQQNRKFGQIDASYMKRAEDLLYGEFAVALGVPPEEIPDYISKRLEALTAQENEA